MVYCGARLQPGARLCSTRATRLSRLSRLSQLSRLTREGPARSLRVPRPPMRPLRQPLQCSAEHLQAVAAAVWAGAQGLLTLRPQHILVLAAYFLIWKPLAARMGEQRDYEEMQALMSKLGYPPLVLARLKCMTVDEFLEAVEAEGSREALLTRWMREGPRVGCQQLPLLHAAAMHCAGGAPGCVSGRQGVS